MKKIANSSEMAVQWRKGYFVSCWHMNQHENNAMWKCYCEGADAVAMKTTYSKLRSCLRPHVFLGVVRYIDYTTERLPSLNMLEYITHKQLHFRFENEVRAVCVAFLDNTEAVPLFEKEDQPGVYVYAPNVDLSHLIEAVVLHPDATPAFEASMAALCSSKALPPPLRSRKLTAPVF